MKQGTGSTVKATLTWVHMHALNFLEQTRSNISTFSNTSVEEEIDASNADITNEAEEGTGVEQTVTEPVEAMEGVGEEYNTNTEINFPQIQELKTNINEDPPPRKKTRIGNEQLLESINKRQNERQRIFQKLEESIASPGRNHPIQTFCASIADTVMSFPPVLKVRAKKEVLDVVSRLELEMWQTDSRSTTSTSRGSLTSLDTATDYDCTTQSSYNIQESQAFTNCADIFSNYPSL